MCCSSPIETSTSITTSLWHQDYLCKHHKFTFASRLFIFTSITNSLKLRDYFSHKIENIYSLGKQTNNQTLYKNWYFTFIHKTLCISLLYRILKKLSQNWKILQHVWKYKKSTEKGSILICMEITMWVMTSMLPGTSIVGSIYRKILITVWNTCKGRQTVPKGLVWYFFCSSIQV